MYFSIISFALIVLPQTHHHLTDALETPIAHGTLAYKCNLEQEFLCLANKQCISKKKVCNFINDCPDGQDEQRCGSCQFGAEPKWACGLELLNDRLIQWKPDKENEQMRTRLKELGEPEHFIYLGLNLWQSPHLIDRVQTDSMVFEPKVLFPHLRPTDNGGCRFALQMHSINQRVHGGQQAPLANGNFSALTSAQINLDPNDSWPLFNIYIIKPANSSLANGDRREFQKLASITMANSRNWSKRDFYIGRMNTVWSLLIHVKTRLSSDSLLLGDFKFLDCRPEDPGKLEANEVLDLSVATSGDIKQLCDLKRGKFLCKITGNCISRENVCDFNADCGPLDHTDEMFCDEYQGMCDFEESDLCGWTDTTRLGHGWLWVGSKDRRELIDGKVVNRFFRPHGDHTFQSSTEQINGHFLLLNAQQLQENQLYRLMGPGVKLRSSALPSDKCALRFWISTAPALSDHLANHSFGAYLSVGYEKISANELFNQSQGSIGNFAPGEMASAQDGSWRRFEVLLADKQVRSSVSLHALELTFGNLSAADLALFISANGYLALDDFSFTPGCELTYRDEPPEIVCGEHQFYCKHPSEQTGAYCIPRQMHCDFKSDCGPLAELVGNPSEPLADGDSEDELDCPRECAIGTRAACEANLLDGGEHALFNFQLKPFKLTRSKLTGTDELSQTVQFALFEPNRLFSETIEQRSLAAVGGGAASGRQQLVLTSETRIELAQFSMSHGACKFELDYQWSGRASNVKLMIQLHNSLAITDDHMWTKLSTLYEENAQEFSGSKRRLLKLRIGENLTPFEVHIGLRLVGPLGQYTRKGQTYSGSLRVFSYNFTECAFASGLIEARNQPHVVPLEDESNAWPSFEDQEENFEEKEEAAAAAALNKTCPEGLFQCHAPILCLPRELLCDMQRDCQLRGIDEVNCEHRGAQQFDFELPNQLDSPQGWLNDQRNEANFELHQAASSGAPIASRLRLVNWPRVDHTASKQVNGKATKRGSFMGLVPKMLHGQPMKTMAIVYAPRMLKSSECKRMVLHLYEWAGFSANVANDYYLQVLIEQPAASQGGGGSKIVSSLGDFSGELTTPAHEEREQAGDGGRPARARRVGWRRLQFELPTAGGPEAGAPPNVSAWFTVALVAQVGDAQQANSLMVALDDISFGPNCQLAADQAQRPFAQLLGAGSSEAITMLERSEENLPSTYSIIFVAFVATCAVIAVSLLVFALIVSSLKRTSLVEQFVVGRECEISDHSARGVSFTMNRIHTYKRLDERATPGGEQADATVLATSSETIWEG